MKNQTERQATRMKGILIFLTLIAITSIAFSVGTTKSNFYDQEETSGNSYGAWTSIQWTQTTQSDFNAGSLTNVSTTSSPGDAMLTEVPDCTEWYCPWNYRKMITVNHSMVADNLANFTVLINLTSDADLASSALADGDDILFTSADGTTKLDHEIENFTFSTGKLIAWVRVPSLSSSTDTAMYMYFGNPAAGNQQNVQGVWDANFTGVWHLKENPAGTAPQMMDSTSNAYNGTSFGTMTSSDQVDARINGGLDFDGSNDFIGITDIDEVDGATQLTVGAWIKLADLTRDNMIVTKGQFAANQEFLMWRDETTAVGFRTNTFSAQVGSGSAQAIYYGSSGLLNNNNWHYVVVTYRGNSATGLRGYVDGVEDTAQSPVSTLSVPSLGGSTTTPARIAAAYFGSGNFFSGLIDEVRISSTVRSSAWIATEYNNTNSPSTFYSVGFQESLPMVYVPSGTIASQVKDTGETGARWDALEWDEGLGGGTDITFGVRASDTSFLKDNTTLSWTSIGGTSPVYAGLPTGRYFQWRATLTTPDTSQSPVLNEVRAYYT